MDETMAIIIVAPFYGVAYIMIGAATVALIKYTMTIFESADQTAISEALGAIAAGVKSGSIASPTASAPKTQ